MALLFLGLQPPPPLLPQPHGHLSSVSVCVTGFRDTLFQGDLDLGASAKILLPRTVMLSRGAHCPTQDTWQGGINVRGPGRETDRSHKRGPATAVGQCHHSASRRPAPRNPTPGALMDMWQSQDSHLLCQEDRMPRPLWKTGWQFLTELSRHPPHDPTILILGIYPKQMTTHVRVTMCPRMSPTSELGTQLIHPPTGKQTNCGTQAWY